VGRRPQDHLADVIEAIRKIRRYTRGGPAAFRRNSMARDAVAARLIQIGQAVKDAADEGLDLAALAPGVPWRDVAGMRDRLAHKYWDIDCGIVWGVVESELGPLERAVRSMLRKSRARKRAAPRSGSRARR
jgi:uncharacterized protein with HEPN domain